MLVIKRIFLVVIIICLTVIISFCTSRSNPAVLNEGIIEYSAKVVGHSHPFAGLAPSEAIIKFKNNKLQFEMSSMGILDIKFISNPIQKTLTQMIKFMDIQSACIQTEAEVLRDHKDYLLKFKETTETKKIAGYICKRVIACFVNDTNSVFDVYYTNELGLDSINNIGPYKSIRGMLMEYRLKKMGLEMCFTAKSVKKETVGDEIFEIPKHYKIITHTEMEKIFTDMQN